MTSSNVPHTNHQSKVEITWDQFASGDLPESPARALFRSIVIDITAQAKGALPEANGRVERARDLVLANLVTRNADGTYTVRSASSRGKSYTVNGECTCPDAEKLADKRCKHRIATWIWRKAQQVLTEQLGSNGHRPEEPPAAEPVPPTTAPVAETEPAPATPPLQTHHEAPASMNCYVTIGSYKVQVTLRGDDEQQLLTRMQAFLSQFPPPAEPPPATPSKAPEPQQPEGWCRRHDVQMKRNSNANGFWWSHRLNDGSWCHGK
jgi:hypothetical protein